MPRYSPFNPPPPLTEDECRAIWRWERVMLLVCGGATAALALIFTVGWLAGSAELTQRLILAWFAALVVIGIVAPLRERCPRCRRRLSNMWRFSLAEKCRGCGVEFPRPLSRDEKA